LSKIKSIAKTDAKNAIMDAAEVLMAEHGIRGISLRRILAKAGANTASLHYHFGSREGLLEALLARGGRAMSERRMEMTAELLASDKPKTPHDIANIIVDPMIELLQSDRAGIHQREERKYFPEIWRRIERLAVSACGDVQKNEMRLRLTMGVDTMLQSLGNADFMADEWNGKKDQAKLLVLGEILKGFLAGGFRGSAISSAHGARFGQTTPKVSNIASLGMILGWMQLFQNTVGG
jgi:AcrR family transcriptional regulator